MKKINWNFLIFSCIVCLLPICMGLYFYEELPEKMAIHFNIENQADNYASKNLTLFGLPLLMAAIQAFICIRSDINRNENENPPKIIKITKWIVPLLSIIVYTLTILVGLEKTVDVGKIILIISGTIFIAIGNYMPKMNYKDAIGFVKPIPDNEKTFKEMMRIMGYTFVIGGIAIIVSSFISNKVAFITILGLCVLLSAENLYFPFKKN